jgi:Ca2+-transporting ATPase
MVSEKKPLYAQIVDEVLQALDVDPEQGLNREEVRSRRRQHGPNSLRRARRRSVWTIILEQAKSVVLAVMGAAAVLAFLFQQWAEGIAIAAVFLVNGLIGFFSEWRATRSMEALRRIGKRQARVRRAGTERTVAVRELVPGDVVIIEGGDVAPADLRLIEANKLRVDESALTGESVPVNKKVDAVEAETPLAERSDMLFKGTTVVEGSGTGVVAATGMNTELGHIAELTESAEKETSPLQRRLDQLGRRLAWITVAIAGVVAALGLLSGRPTLIMIETAIALGVAAIPEGLPIVATIALARGMWLMAQRQALINRLPAVETLGATGVIFTDKTGTLTENRMTVQRLVTSGGEREFDDDEDHDYDDDQQQEQEHEQGQGNDAGASDIAGLLRDALEVGVLCNNASLSEEDDEEAQGDPTEVALIAAGARAGLSRRSLLEERPEVREVAFDPDVMMMATFHEVEDAFQVAVKGAPQAVLSVCETVARSDTERESQLDDASREQWADRVEELAAEGLRVLALADKRVTSPEAEPYEKLRLLGLVALHDPSRPDAKEAIAACNGAGIRVIMVTGDQPQTAAAIGRQVGLAEDGISIMEGTELGEPDELSSEQRRRILEADVFARVSPEQKLDLVSIFQEEGETVAMTGDGVNDAPALKKADIGVAMGIRGTDAAREAADMVLKDDSLSSIVAAVRQGRIIFGNIRKSVVFMLCTNVAEIIAVAIASILSVPLPLLPLQILFLNVLTDVFPALALGVGEGDPQVMAQPPRDPKEPVLTRRHWLEIGGWAVGIAACVLGGLALALTLFDFPQPRAVTVSFLTLAFGKLWFVFNLRDPGSRFLRNDVVLNRWIWASIVLCIGLLIAAVYLPGLSDVLRTEALGGAGWGLVLALSLPPLIVGQILRWRQSERPGLSYSNA